MKKLLLAALFIVGCAFGLQADESEERSSVGTVVKIQEITEEVEIPKVPGEPPVENPFAGLILVEFLDDCSLFNDLAAIVAPESEDPLSDLGPLRIVVPLKPEVFYTYKLQDKVRFFYKLVEEGGQVGVNFIRMEKVD